MTEDRSKVLELAIAQIEKQYGRGARQSCAGRSARLESVSEIPSGAVSLDAARVWGLSPRAGGGNLRAGIRRQDDHDAARDRAGAEDGRPGAFIDDEHALDPADARKLGVDVENSLVCSRTTASRRWKCRRR